VLYYSLNPIHRSDEVTPPIAAFQAPAQATVGKVVTFDGSASSGQVPIVAWEWSYGDGASGTGKVVQHVYNLPGNYSVQLVVTDSQQQGFQDSKYRGLAVTQPRVPTLAPRRYPPWLPRHHGSPTHCGALACHGSPTNPGSIASPPAQPSSPPRLPHQPRQPSPPWPPRQPFHHHPPGAQPTPAVPPQAVIQGPSTSYVGEPIYFDAAVCKPAAAPTLLPGTSEMAPPTSPGPESKWRQSTIIQGLR
jgi:PKD repeat protein